VLRGQCVLRGQSGTARARYELVREILGVELAGRESQTPWRDVLVALKERALHRVEFG